MSKHNFEAETGKILELLTHSIYSNKEIFLRELISNASDAIDKARLKSLTDTTFLGDDNTFEIKLSIDAEKNTITIEDNGIGMTEEELHSCIGTIAKSGTKEFLEKLKKAKEDTTHNLIGQFGVGFYSSFMVADTVELETKSPLDTKAHKWVSNGKNDYEISESDKKTRGTKITLFIDEANKELVTEWKVRELVKKYSNYVGVPIMLLTSPQPSPSEERESKDSKEKTWEQVNETTPLWKKSKSSIKPEEYTEFYKSVSMDFNDPLTHAHIDVEGMVSYKSILFVPKEKNMFNDMRDPSKEYGPKLYVQNVLILEHAKELLPVWLRFVSGVVETSDLPLNISREMLQSNSTLDTIKKSLTKKVIGEIKKVMHNNEVEYLKFLENYGPLLKEGIHYEPEMKEEIVEVVKFPTLLSDKKLSLDEYLSSVNSEQGTVNSKKDENKECCKDGACDCHHDNGKMIYYITGKSRSEVLASPYLEQFRKNKVDVLLLTDPIDEWIVQALHEYKGAMLKSVTASDIKLKEETKEEKKKQEKAQKEYKDLLELVKNTVGVEKLEKVELNPNLGSAVGALKTPEGGMTPQMEKMMKAMGQQMPAQKRILELNPESALVKAMKKEFSTDMKSKRLADITKYAYAQAILLEGGELEDMAGFVQMTNMFAGEYLK